MRWLNLLTISVSFVLLCTTISTAKDSSKQSRVRIPAAELHRLRQQIIAARRERLLRHRKPVSPRGPDSSVATKTLSPITKPSCPDGCTCLVTNDVKCNLNSLKRIPRGLPNNVIKLDLGMNDIRTFKRKDFSHIRASLLNLYLHNNSITSIGNGNFVELKVLQLLRLSHNNIKEIRKSSLYGMKNVQSLHLDHNKLSFIHPLAFRGLTKLQTLQLEGNLLSQIHKDLFITMEFEHFFKFSNIDELNLQKNKFRYLPRQVFDHVTDDITVYLGLNPWDCSCQSKWLKQKMFNLTNSRCGAFNSAAYCPICESPDYVKDRPMNDVSTVCSHSSQKDIDSIQAETDQILFRTSGFIATEVSFLFANNDQAMLTARCRLAKFPSTVVKQDGNSGGSFFASFEGVFRCVMETLDSTLTAESYEDREFSLISQKERTTQQGKPSERYAVEGGDNGSPFTDVSVTTKSDFLLNNNSAVVILSDEDSEETNVYNVKLKTSFIYKFDPKKTKFSKKPWVLIQSPQPSKVGVTIVQSGKSLSIKCKAVGKLKPSIAWILPSGETLHAGKKTARYAVHKSGKLTIRSLSAEDSGIYRCIATIRNPLSEEAKTDVAASKIFVVEPTKAGFSLNDVSPETHQETIEKGDTWTSQCHIVSLYDATTVWVTPDNRVLVGDSAYRRGQVTTYQNGSISVIDFKKANEGLYRCLGVNVEDQEEYTVYLSLPSDKEDSVETMLIETQDYPEPDDLLVDVLPNIEDEFSDDDMSEEQNFIETNVIPGDELDFEDDDTDPLEEEIIDDVIPEMDIPLQDSGQNQSTVETTTGAIESQTANSVVSENAEKILPDVSEVKTPDLMAGEVIEIDLDDEYYDDDLDEDTLKTGNDADTLSTHPNNESKTVGIGESDGAQQTLTPTTASPDVTTKHSNFHHPITRGAASHAPISKSPDATMPSKYPNPTNDGEASYDKTTALQISDSDATNHNETSHSSIKNLPKTTTASKYFNFLKTPKYVIRNPVKIDTTYRTHLNKNNVSSPTESVDITTQPESPKLPATQTRQQQFDIYGVAEPDVERALEPTISGKKTIYPTHQERISTNFKPQHDYLELKAEPDATANPSSQQNRGNTFSFLDNFEFGFHVPGIDISDILLERQAVQNATAPTQKVNGSKEESFKDRGNRTQVDPVVDLLPDSIDPGILFSDNPNANPTAPDVLDAKEEYSTTSKSNHTEERPNNSTSKEDLSQNTPNNVDPGLLLPQSMTEGSMTTPSFVVELTNSDVDELDVTQAPIPAATGHQVIDSEALIPDLMYDVDLIPTISQTSQDNDFDHIDGNKEPTKSNDAYNHGLQSTTQNRSASLFPDNNEVIEPELNVAEVPSSSKLISTTSSVLLTKTILATTKLVTPETDSKDFGEAVTISQSHDVSSEATTRDVIEPPIVTVNTPTSRGYSIEEDPNSAGVYEILNVPAGKVNQRPALDRLDRDKIFAREHGRVLLPCMPLNVSPLLSWTFTWTLPNGDVYTRPGRIVSRDWSKYIHRNGSLLLTRLEGEDGGNYDCVAVNLRKNVEYHTHLSLEILERLRIHNPRNEYLQVKTGSDVMIPCDVTGFPHPNIIWETPWGVTVDDTGYIEDIEVLWNGTLRIFKMKPGLRGSYICYAKNGYDLQMRTVTISIMMQRPVFITPTSEMVAVRSGGTISLKCKAEGYPEPTIQWILAKGGMIRPNEAIFSGSRFMPKYRVQKDGTLIIRRANERDVGNYHCVVTNYLGRSASTIRLMIGVMI